MASQTEDEYNCCFAFLMKLIAYVAPQARHGEPALQEPNNQQLVAIAGGQQQPQQQQQALGTSTLSSMLSLPPDVVKLIMARLSFQDEHRAVSVCSELRRTIRPFMTTRRRHYLKLRKIHQPREAVYYHAHFSMETSHAWDPQSLAWRRLPPFNFLPHNPDFVVDPDDVTQGFRAFAAHKGLVWLAYQGRFYVCNPLTRSYTAVPPPPVDDIELMFLPGILRVSDSDDDDDDDHAISFTLWAFRAADGELLKLRSDVGMWWDGWKDCGRLQSQPGETPVRRAPLMVGDVLYWWQAEWNGCTIAELTSYDTAGGRVSRRVHLEVASTHPMELPKPENLQAVEVAGQVWVVRLVTSYRQEDGAYSRTHVRVRVSRLELDGAGASELVVGAPGGAEVPLDVVHALELPFPGVDHPSFGNTVYSTTWIMAGEGSRICMLAVAPDGSASRVLHFDVVTREWTVGGLSPTPPLFRESTVAQVTGFGVRSMYSVVRGAFQLTRAARPAAVNVPVT